MFDDPLLVIRCELPIGWCVDPESSLFRLVFRPWDRRDERVIITVLPTAAAPTVPDGDWADSVRERLGLSVPTTTMALATGAAIAAPLAATDSGGYRRVVRRGRALDVIADHVGCSKSETQLSPVLLRIAASTRAPARPPLPGTHDITSLQEATTAVAALTEEADASSIIRAMRRMEKAAEECWLRSLLGSDLAQIDLAAFAALLRAREALSSLSNLLGLRATHAMLMRAVPSAPPTEPFIPVGEELRPALADICKGKFGGVLEVLRRHPEARPFAQMSDDQFGSDQFIQTLLSRLITEEVRDAFERDERVRPEAAYEAVLAQLGSMGMEAPDSTSAGRRQVLVDDLGQLGRALTAYVEAALRADNRDDAAEAADVLTTVGEQLFEIAPRDADAEQYRRDGVSYAVTGLYAGADVLIRAADRPSLEGAISKLDEAYRWLAQPLAQAVDEVNVCHNDTLAALQLGDADRARRAVDRGTAANARLGDERQAEFFSWGARLADLVENTPGALRSFPELQYEGIVAEAGPEDALASLCVALERELATDPTGVTTIERLVLAARLLGDDASEGLIAAVESLLGLKRLLVSRTQKLQIGADDSLLARRVAADAVDRLASAGKLAPALAAADRGRARSLLLDLQLRPGSTAQLQTAIDQGLNPGDRLLVESTMRDRIPSPYRPPPSWAGLSGVRAVLWLRRLAGDLVRWVDGLTDPLGIAPLTDAELIACVRIHGEPIVVFHPAGDRVALFLVTPEGAIHHAWSPASTSEILEQAGQLRNELGVWVSTRQQGRDARLTALDDGLGDYRTAAAAAYQSLFAPLREHLAGHMRLTIIPYRELGALPYALLEDEAGTALLESFAISTVPSIATLAVVTRRRPASAEPRAAYVVGDPAAPSLERLPGAAREATSVRARLKAAHPDLAIRHRAGRRATPASYLDEARGARLVHLSCHAGVGTTASASALYLAPAANGDATLDVTEIAGVPLGGGLVFLAACRSGTGRASADGTAGLAREFLRAGARSVVASYWKVPDEATRVLVDHFYDAFLGDRNDVATALQYAMTATRADLSPRHMQAPTAHASDWGSFFVLGDGTLTDDL